MYHDIVDKCQVSFASWKKLESNKGYLYPVCMLRVEGIVSSETEGGSTHSVTSAPTYADALIPTEGTGRFSANQTVDSTGG